MDPAANIWDGQVDVKAAENHMAMRIETTPMNHPLFRAARKERPKEWVNVSKVPKLDII